MAPKHAQETAPVVACVQLKTAKHENKQIRVKRTAADHTPVQSHRAKVSSAPTKAAANQLESKGKKLVEGRERTLSAAAESKTKPTATGIARDALQDATVRTTALSHLFFIASIPEPSGTGNAVVRFSFSLPRRNAMSLMARLVFSAGVKRCQRGELIFLQFGAFSLEVP